jgi:hypothetical protein
MSNRSVNKVAKELFIYVFLLFILLIVSINIDNYLKPKEVNVLGSKTENTEGEFWQDFLTKNPEYVPGWIETGRIDKAREIDPNYIKP